MWKKLSLFVAIPVIILGHAQAFLTDPGNAHKRDPYVDYDYLRIRNKVRRPPNSIS